MNRWLMTTKEHLLVPKKLKNQWLQNLDYEVDDFDPGVV